MRVLYLDHPEADFLAAQVYLGLCEELGPDSVIDFPHKPSYHGETHRYPSQYTHDPGSADWQTWKVVDGTPMGETSPFAWFPAQPARRQWSLDDVAHEPFDLVVLASPRAVAVEALRRYFRLVGGRRPPLVMVDGEDYPDIRWDLAAEFAPRAYLKRECAIHPSSDIFAASRVPLQIHAFPFAATEITRRPDGAGPLDVGVTMLGGSNRPGGRAECEQAIRLSGANHVIGHVAFDQYKWALAKSRIVVVPRGHGWDTLRFWETASIEGPLLLSEALDVHRPHPFVDGEHACYFRTMAELTDTIRSLLADEARRARIAAAGFAHLQVHHTARARARQLLEYAR